MNAKLLHDVCVSRQLHINWCVCVCRSTIVDYFNEDLNVSMCHLFILISSSNNLHGQQQIVQRSIFACDSCVERYKYFRWRIQMRKRETMEAVALFEQ